MFTFVQGQHNDCFPWIRDYILAVQKQNGSITHLKHGVLLVSLVKELVSKGEGNSENFETEYQIKKHQ